MSLWHLLLSLLGFCLLFSLNPSCLLVPPFFSCSFFTVNENSWNKFYFQDRLGRRHRKMSWRKFTANLKKFKSKLFPNYFCLFMWRNDWGWSPLPPLPRTGIPAGLGLHSRFCPRTGKGEFCCCVSSRHGRGNKNQRGQAGQIKIIVTKKQKNRRFALGTFSLCCWYGLLFFRPFCRALQVFSFT